jgi:putative endopeptidase
MRMIGRAMLCVELGVALITTSVAFGSACAQDFETELSYGTWGVDLKAGEPSTRPGNDFFKYVNGTWVEQTMIPADQSDVTLRSLMTDRIRSRLRAMLETAARNASHEPSDISGKVGAFYKAFMDENAIDAAGSTPIDTILTAVRPVTAPETLGAMMGRAVHDFGGSFFDISIDVDAKDPSRYAVYLNQGGLGLPDRDYYFGEDSEFRKVKATYQRYIEQLLSFVGWPDPAGNAARIIALESRIAEAHWTKLEAREIDKTYNPMSIAELESFAPGFPWRSFLAEAKLGSTTRVIVSEKGAFPKIAAVFASTPVDTLRAWHAFKIASQAAPYLSKRFSDTYFDMYQRTLLGQQQQEARWKRGVFVVSGDIDGDEDPLGHIGWAVGQLYAKHYFPATVKAQVNDLIGHLIRVFRERLNNRDWMDSATKAQALEKLDSFIVMVGYPDSPRRDYSQLVIRDDDPVGNVRRAAGLGLPRKSPGWSGRPK